MTRFFPIVAVSIAAALGGCMTTASIVPAPDRTAMQDQSGLLPFATSLPDSSVPAAIPSGFVGFCLRNADQCELPKNSPIIALLDTRTFALMTHVNRSMNASIKPADDVQHYGPADYWTIATDSYGDCEDFALTKRKALIEAGLPVAALRLAVVMTSTKEQHAILTVATDRGDFVLDSLSDEVRPWTDSTYTWLERQDPKKPGRWDMLSADNSASSPTAATRGN
jgi:predicted transglutaminase-like cysteine proteinase